MCFNLGHGDVALWVNLLNLSTLMLTKIQKKNNIYKSSLEYLGPDLFSTLKIEFENMKREYYEYVHY